MKRFQEILEQVFPERRKSLLRETPAERTERRRKAEAALQAAEADRKAKENAPTKWTPTAQAYIDAIRSNGTGANQPGGAPARAYLIDRGTWTEADGRLPARVGYVAAADSPLNPYGKPDLAARKAEGAVVYAFSDLPPDLPANPTRGAAVSLKMLPGGEKITRGRSEGRAFVIPAGWWDDPHPDPWPKPDLVVLLEGPADALAIARLKLPGVELRAVVARVNAKHIADVKGRRALVIGDADDTGAAAARKTQEATGCHLLAALPSDLAEGREWKDWKDPDEWLRGCDPHEARTAYAVDLNDGFPPAAALERLLMRAIQGHPLTGVPPKEPGKRTLAAGIIAEGLDVNYMPPLPPIHGGLREPLPQEAPEPPPVRGKGIS